MAVKKVPDGYELVPPDGGWGWMVLAGCVFSGLMISMPLQALGLIFQDILRELDTTTTVAGWIPAITVATAQFIAPFNAILIDVYSPRVSAICGGLCVSIGLILCFFANSVEVLFFTFGVLVGAGLGMVTNASYVLLSYYFKDKYGIVTGIAMASFSTGKFVFSPVIQVMLDHYDYRGVLLIIGGMNLNVLVGASLFQPAKQHYILKPIANSNTSSNVVIEAKKISSIEEINNHKFADKTNSRKPVLLINDNYKRTSEESDHEAGKTLLKTSASKTMIYEQQRKLSQACSMEMLPLSVPAMEKQSANIPKEITTQEIDEPDNCCSKGPLKSLKFSQLKQPIFYIILFSGFLHYVSSIYFGVFLPSLAIENGLQPIDAALIMSMRAAAEIVGRLTSPWLQNYFKLNLMLFYVSLAVAQGISIISISRSVAYIIKGHVFKWCNCNFELKVLVFTYSLAGMGSVTIITGIFYGGHTGLTMLVIVTCVGMQNLSATLALSQFIQGILCLPVGPLIGFLRDSVGTFDICFYAIAGMQFFIAAVWGIKPLVVKKS